MGQKRYWFAGNVWRAEVVPMQVVHRTNIPEPIAQLAWAEYQRRFSSQNFDDFFHGRGGFSSTEIILLLADALERQEAE